MSDIEVLRDALIEAEAELNDLRQKLTERDSRIGRLEETNSHLKAQVEELATSASELITEKIRLENDLTLAQQAAHNAEPSENVSLSVLRQEIHRLQNILNGVEEEKEAAEWRLRELSGVSVKLSENITTCVTAVDPLHHNVAPSMKEALALFEFDLHGTLDNLVKQYNKFMTSIEYESNILCLALTSTSRSTSTVSPATPKTNRGLPPMQRSRTKVSTNGEVDSSGNSLELNEKNIAEIDLLLKEQENLLRSEYEKEAECMIADALASAQAAYVDDLENLRHQYELQLSANQGVILMSASGEEFDPSRATKDEYNMQLEGHVAALMSENAVLKQQLTRVKLLDPLNELTPESLQDEFNFALSDYEQLMLQQRKEMKSIVKKIRKDAKVSRMHVIATALGRSRLFRALLTWKELIFKKKCVDYVSIGVDERMRDYDRDKFELETASLSLKTDKKRLKMQKLNIVIRALCGFHLHKAFRTFKTYVSVSKIDKALIDNQTKLGELKLFHRQAMEDQVMLLQKAKDEGHEAQLKVVVNAMRNNKRRYAFFRFKENMLEGRQFRLLQNEEKRNLLSATEKHAELQQIHEAFELHKEMTAHDKMRVVVIAMQKSSRSKAFLQWVLVYKAAEAHKIHEASFAEMEAVTQAHVDVLDEQTAKFRAAKAESKDAHVRLVICALRNHAKQRAFGKWKVELHASKIIKHKIEEAERIAQMETAQQMIVDEHIQKLKQSKKLSKEERLRTVIRAMQNSKIIKAFGSWKSIYTYAVLEKHRLRAIEKESILSQAHEQEVSTLASSIKDAKKQSKEACIRLVIGHLLKGKLYRAWRQWKEDLLASRELKYRAKQREAREIEKKIEQDVLNDRVRQCKDAKQHSRAQQMKLVINSLRHSKIVSAFMKFKYLYFERQERKSSEEHRKMRDNIEKSYQAELTSVSELLKAQRRQAQRQMQVAVSRSLFKTAKRRAWMIWLSFVQAQRLAAANDESLKMIQSNDLRFSIIEKQKMENEKLLIKKARNARLSTVICALTKKHLRGAWHSWVLSLAEQKQEKLKDEFENEKRKIKLNSEALKKSMNVNIATMEAKLSVSSSEIVGMKERSVFELKQFQRKRLFTATRVLNRTKILLLFSFWKMMVIKRKRGEQKVTICRRSIRFHRIVQVYYAWRLSAAINAAGHRGAAPRDIENIIEHSPVNQTIVIKHMRNYALHRAWNTWKCLVTIKRRIIAKQLFSAFDSLVDVAQAMYDMSGDCETVARVMDGAVPCVSAAPECDIGDYKSGLDIVESLTVQLVEFANQIEVAMAERARVYAQFAKAGLAVPTDVNEELLKEQERKKRAQQRRAKIAQDIIDQSLSPNDMSKRLAKRKVLSEERRLLLEELCDKMSWENMEFKATIGVLEEDNESLNELLGEERRLREQLQSAYERMIGRAVTADDFKRQ